MLAECRAARAQPSTVYWWQKHNISFEGTMLYCIKKRRTSNTRKATQGRIHFRRTLSSSLHVNNVWKEELYSAMPFRFKCTTGFNYTKDICCQNPTRKATLVARSQMCSDFETRSNPLFNSGSGDMNEAAPRRIKSKDNSSQNAPFRLFSTILAHSFLRSKNILVRAPGPEKEQSVDL